MINFSEAKARKLASRNGRYQTCVKNVIKSSARSKGDNWLVRGEGRGKRARFHRPVYEFTCAAVDRRGKNFVFLIEIDDPREKFNPGDDEKTR